MQHESKKIAQIVNEILALLLLYGAENVEIKVNTNLTDQCQETEITLIQYNSKCSKELVEKLSYNLNTPRQHELEGYYWQLVGEDDNGDELHLVGTMIDKAKAEMKGNDLYIQLIRKN